MRSESFRTVLTQEQHAMQGVPAFGRSTGADAALPLIPHSHKDKYEIVLLSAGVRCLHADGVNYTVYENNAFFVRPNEVHSADRPTKTSGEILWFQLNATGNLLDLPEQTSKFIQFKLSSCQTRLFCITPSIFSSFQESFRLLNRNDTISRLKGQSLFLYALLSLFEAPKAAQILSPEIDRVKQYIMLHLHDAIDMDVLCDKSGMPMRTFLEEFERQIGFSPKEYILRSKIERSCIDIAKTQKPFADIAFSYHFSSASYFSILFKRYQGCTPKQYRKKYSKKRGSDHK